MLVDVGARGTYYAAAALMDTANHLGPHFHKEDLLALLAAGHELASHTYSHISAYRTNAAHYAHEVEKGYQTLARTVGVGASKHFSYPYGEITLRAKRAVGPKMQSCRGAWPGLNRSPVDLNLLKANRLYGDIDQLAPAKALIDENHRQKSWLIFYTHDVRMNPSPYGCTPRFLEQVIRAAVDSEARIATVAEVVALAERA